MKSTINKAYFIAVFLTTAILSGCTQKAELSQNELELLKTTGFDKEILMQIRSNTDSVIYLADANPDAEICFKDSVIYLDFKKKDIRGISFHSDAQNAVIILGKLKKVFKDKGYLMYISETHFGYAPDEVTVLKTSDKFDILRFEALSGVNYDLYTEDVIQKLTAWDNQFGLEFTAAGFDFAEAKFVQMPNDLSVYAEELYEFCPDIVDQGTGSVEELIKEIKISGRLYLWWD
jgi:hypothetical protein